MTADTSNKLSSAWRSAVRVLSLQRNAPHPGRVCMLRAESFRPDFAHGYEEDHPTGMNATMF